jgi:hypothetical protein
MNIPIYHQHPTNIYQMCIFHLDLDSQCSLKSKKKQELVKFDTNIPVVIINIQLFEKSSPLMISWSAFWWWLPLPFSAPENETHYATCLEMSDLRGILDINFHQFADPFLWANRLAVDVLPVLEGSWTSMNLVLTLTFAWESGLV